MTLQIAPFLQAVVVNNASDLHIKAGSAPKIRISGSLVPRQVDPLTADGAWEIIRGTMPDGVLRNSSSGPTRPTTPCRSPGSAGSG